MRYYARRRALSRKFLAILKGFLEGKKSACRSISCRGPEGLLKRIGDDVEHAIEILTYLF